MQMSIRKIFILLVLVITSTAFGQIKILPNNAYELKLSDDCVATIGDDKSPSFRSQIDFKFWDEDTITFLEENVTGTQTYSNRVIELGETNRTTQYKVTEGAIKWIEILKEKPASNEWKLKLGGNWKDFTFTRQTPFTEIYPPEDIVYFERDGIDWISALAGKYERPLGIEGSIAIYHKTKRNHLLGGRNYRTGKALHIPKPKAVGANDKWVWCDIRVEDGIYIRTIPWSLLDDSTAYPITINDTLGYESTQATGHILGADDCIAFYIGTMPFAGTLDSIEIYDSDASGVNGCYVGLYSGNAGAPLTRVFTSIALDFGLGAAWHEAFAGSEVLGNGLEIYPAVAVSAASDWRALYDEVASFWAGYEASNYEISSPPPTWDSTEPDWRYSGFINYTQSGAAAAGQVIIINEN